LPVVRHDAKAGECSLDVMQSGLVLNSAKDIKVGFANIRHSFLHGKIARKIGKGAGRRTTFWSPDPLCARGAVRVP
jgi:hypothetical protein